MNPPDLDVLIIGAGLSGIGAAVHLGKSDPDIKWRIWEGRQRIGGTWDLFRYPGIRSDSDMYTLGFHFKPWRHEKSIADGSSILEYMDEVVDEHALADRIYFDHQVIDARWDSNTARWTINAEHSDGSASTISARFLINCGGYYSYSEAYQPEFPGMDQFTGKWVHPQFWPQGLDVSGKHVVVIGSGATAVTLAPALAEQGAQVTMLQRSPSYVLAQASKDCIADKLRQWLPMNLAYKLIRAKNIWLNQLFFQVSRLSPRMIRRWLQGRISRHMGEDFVEQHFSPAYNPWQQRLCLAPDADLFKAVRDEKMSIVTDHIERIEPGSVVLKSGDQLPADIIVSATGLKLKPAVATIYIDDQPYDFSRAFTYRGIMMSNLPNFAALFGYTNASWTLKTDLANEYICRLLRHMRRTGNQVVTPVLREPEKIKSAPMIDFSSGYFMRARDQLPRQADSMPWRTHQNYLKDWISFKWGSLRDGVLQFNQAGG